MLLIRRQRVFKSLPRSFTWRILMYLHPLVLWNNINKQLITYCFLFFSRIKTCRRGRSLLGSSLPRSIDWHRKQKQLGTVCLTHRKSLYSAECDQHNINLTIDKSILIEIQFEYIPVWPLSRSIYDSFLSVNRPPG